ncbi:hypothetical protein TRFO_08717 [Tritrichomonas foetus]|uniref:Doublecortin domain-containing protein n=1 Tax=Tritrichomonas foetus TaxID=1144522 RepID=A0A1J4JMC9_9EUKA|nr:hypothetical protein TRFO_08717 [Tritrichomonas foetus]|eukprot:OHS98723.1 hypothetical protein TRFO_08717 [Tritrichomonas foetus]
MTDIVSSMSTQKKTRFLYLKSKENNSIPVFQIDYPRSYNSLLEVAKQKFKGKVTVRGLFDENGRSVRMIEGIKPGSTIFVSKNSNDSAKGSPDRKTFRTSSKQDNSPKAEVRDGWTSGGKPMKLPNTPFNKIHRRSKTPQKKNHSPSNLINADSCDSYQPKNPDHEKSENDSIPKPGNDFPYNRNLSLTRSSSKNQDVNRSLPLFHQTRFNRPHSSQKIRNRKDKNSHSSTQLISANHSSAQISESQEDFLISMNSTPSPKHIESKEKLLGNSKNLSPSALLNFSSDDSPPPKNPSPKSNVITTPNSAGVNVSFMDDQNLVLNQSNKKPYRNSVDFVLPPTHRRSNSKDYEGEFGNQKRRRQTVQESASATKILLSDKKLKNLTASFSTLRSIESAIEVLTYLSPKNDNIYGAKQANIDTGDTDDDIYATTLSDSLKKNENKAEEKDTLDEFRDSDDSDLFSSETENAIVPLIANPIQIAPLSPISNENNLIRIQKNEIAPMSSPDKLDQFMESDDDLLSFGSDDIDDDFHDTNSNSTLKPQLNLSIQNSSNGSYNKMNDLMDNSSDDSDDDENDDDESDDDFFNIPLPAIVRRRSDIIRNISDLSDFAEKPPNTPCHQRSNSRTNYRFSPPDKNSSSLPKSRNSPSNFRKNEPRIPKKPNVPSVTRKKPVYTRSTSKYENMLNSLRQTTSMPPTDEEFLYNLIDTAVDEEPLAALGLSPEIYPSNLLPEMERQQSSAWIAHGCLVACLQVFPDIDEDIFGYDLIVQKSRSILHKHRFSTHIGSDYHLNIGLVGPQKSGKSTFLRILTDQLIADLVQSGIWHDTFVFMLNMESLLLSSNSIDLPGNIYTKMIHSTFQHLAWHRPSLQPFVKGITSFFDSVISRKRLKRLPKNLLNTDEQIAHELQNLGGIFYTLWHTPSCFQQFIATTLAFPKLIAKMFNFARTIFIIDHFDDVHAYVHPGSQFSESEGFWLTQIANFVFTDTNFIISSENMNRFFEATRQRNSIDLYSTTDIINKGLIDNSTQFLVRLEDSIEPIVLTSKVCGGTPAYLALWSNLNSAAEMISGSRSEEYVASLVEATKILLETLFVNEDGYAVKFNVKSVRKIVRKAKK